MNIYQRINEVRKAVKKIARDIEVFEGGKYAATSHDQVTVKVRELEVDHGVVCFPSLVESSMEATGRESKNGTPMFRYSALYDVHFVNADEPEERVVVRQEAHALDFGDKAPGKATSYATKYATLKMYRLVTGDDDEERPEQSSKPAVISEELQQTIMEKLKEWFGPEETDVQAAEKRLNSWLVSQYGKKASVASIPVKDFDRVLKVLEGNRPKNADGQG